MTATATRRRQLPGRELGGFTCGGTSGYVSGSYLSNVLVYAQLSG